MVNEGGENIPNYVSGEHHKPFDINQTTKITSQTTSNNNVENQSRIIDIRQEIENIFPQDEPLIIKNGYFLAKEKEIFNENGGGFVDSHQTRYEKYGFNNYKNSILDKIANQNCILKLKLSGLENPKEFYKVLHERGFNNRWIKDKEVINNLKGLSPSEIAKGIDRINKLGLDLNEYSDLRKKEVFTAIKNISSIDDTCFNRISSELNQYFFLKNKNFKQENHLYNYEYKINYENPREFNYIASEDGINPVFTSLLKFFENGQIDPEVKNRLDLMKEISLLDNSTSIQTDEFIKTKYGAPPRLDDLFVTNNQLFKFTIPFNLDIEIFNNNYKFIYKNITLFDENSRFNIFKNLPDEEIDTSLDKNGVSTFLKQLSKKNTNEHQLKDAVNYVINNYHLISSNFNNNDQKMSFFLELISIPDTCAHDLSDKCGFVNATFNCFLPELIDNLPDQKDKNLWNLIKDLNYPPSFEPLLNGNQEYLTENNLPIERFFETLVLGHSGVHRLVEKGYLKYLSPEDQEFWLFYYSFSEIKGKRMLIDIKNSLINYSKSPNQPKHLFYSDISNKLITVANEMTNENVNVKTIFSFLKEDVLINFSPEDQKIWNFIKNNELPVQAQKLLLNINNKKEYRDFLDKNDKLTSLFFENFKSSNQKSFNEFFYKLAKKNDWQTAFGRENIDKLLSVLPDKTDEKRNAFTHNEYDRTSQFFDFLINNNQINFELTSENIKLVTEYIQKFGLAKSSTVFEYFLNIKNLENGTIKNLPPEYIQNGIKSMEDLEKQVNEFKKKCFNQEQIVNLQELNQFQQGLLSIVTGHAVNRWTRIPLDQIIRDFSIDLANKEIAPLDFHFKATSSEVSKIKTEVKEDLSKNTVFKNLKQEIITTINEPDKIDVHKSKIADILTSKISILSSKEPNDFIKKQMNSFISHIELINQSYSIDSLIENMLTLNLNLGRDKNRDYQEEFNSVLRQLVFQKTFVKHKSPEWRENLKNNLIGGDDVSAVNDSLNFLNNIVKDHALNFGANNEEQYWNEKTFEIMKKYSKVFKNSLSIGFYIKELQEIEKNFQITQSKSVLNIKMIPDRGLIGEMSGYMADVCYTKVYPLLKQYPNLVPYKFIDQSIHDNPEFIGSVLVFKVSSAEDEPLFLVRAFDVPKENEVNIGNFFEKFIDSLSQVAKEIGVKKIIAAGTSGTISNYSRTINYVLSNYVYGKTSVLLKERFDFNGYDITKECYLIRDLK